MKKKTLLKLILIVVFFAGMAGVGYYFLKSAQPKPNKSVRTVPDKLFGWKFPAVKLSALNALAPPLFDVEINPGGKLIAYSTIRDPGGTPRGLPVRLKIPSIGVDSAIEDALITPDGRMDVPVGSVNVAWFSLGPHPGSEGSSVIGGHFGINNGVKFVFYDLDKLKAGDKVYIVDDKGETLAFAVQSIKLFDRNADATTVFTSNDGKAHLNLITCEGIWNQTNGTYPERRVVFTNAIPTEGAVTVVKPTLAKAAETVRPSPVATPSPSVLPTQADTPTPTSTPAPSSPQILIAKRQALLIASAKSLYATPKDGLITSFLLIAIAFMAIKIIRRA